uniref:SFRICE_035181 n=1 Tax=Spodoptera frugiperda TaxID=7108 RepID=A0A2H1VYU0_SPOFR
MVKSGEYIEQWYYVSCYAPLGVAPCGNRTRYTLRGSQLPSHRANSAVNHMLATWVYFTSIEVNRGIHTTSVFIYDCLVGRVVANTTAGHGLSCSIPGANKAFLGFIRSSTESGIVPSIWQLAHPHYMRLITQMFFGKPPTYMSRYNNVMPFIPEGVGRGAHYDTYNIYNE